MAWIVVALALGTAMVSVVVVMASFRLQQGVASFEAVYAARPLVPPRAAVPLEPHPPARRPVASDVATFDSIVENLVRTDPFFADLVERVSHRDD